MVKIKIWNKKGVSPVVATVLIILITFVAFGVLYNFVIPMVRDSLEGGASCFQLRDYGKVLPSEYTCYSETQTQLMIQRGAENESIEGFIVNIIAGAESKRYDIKNEGSTAGVTLYGGGAAVVPSPGSAKTYVFDVSGEKGDLGVIVKAGTICEMGTYNIPPCSLI